MNSQKFCFEFSENFAAGGVKKVVISNPVSITELWALPWASTRWVRGLRGLNYEEILKALKLQSLEKNKVLTHKILFNKINLDATELF